MWRLQALSGATNCFERELKEATPEEQLAARKEQSRPVLDAYYACLRQWESRTMPKSLLGKAMGYDLKWDKLTAFMNDGRLELYNNRGERSIKPFVIGRKNWIFAYTPRGAKASAAIYSVIETAKENGPAPVSVSDALVRAVAGFLPTELIYIDHTLAPI